MFHFIYVYALKNMIRNGVSDSLIELDTYIKPSSRNPVFQMTANLYLRQLTEV